MYLIKKSHDESKWINSSCKIYALHRIKLHKWTNDAIVNFFPQANVWRFICWMFYENRDFIWSAAPTFLQRYVHPCTVNSAFSFPKNVFFFGVVFHELCFPRSFQSKKKFIWYNLPTNLSILKTCLKISMSSFLESIFPPPFMLWFSYLKSSFSKNKMICIWTLYIL